MRRIATTFLLLAVAGAGAMYILTMPRPLNSDSIPDHRPDIANGKTMFWAGGCPSCHAVADAEDDDRLVLAGGVELHTPFGIFRAPNISPDAKYGLGRWTTLEFINAMVRGLAPDGSHYYPAFPFTNYQRMRLEDVIDLKAFLDTLPASDNRVADHDLGFPFNVRRGLGLWKLLYLDGRTFQSEPGESAIIRRGRYLVQGPGHCGACHTPRNLFGGEITSRFLAGAVSLEAEPSKDGDDEGGRIPNITPHKDGIGNWGEQDIAYALESGFDPDFDSFGGSMVEVQENMARLAAADRAAIAAYLKSIPALPSEKL